MTEHVKPRRSYHSPRRQQQAAATRQAILEAAQRLFEQRGYPATTMEQVAAQAVAALKTVYLAFATKSGLLRALWDLRLKGDQDQAAVAERPWYREVVEEPDPERQLRRNAHNARLVKQRIAGVLKVLRSAAPVDPDAETLWRLIQTDFYDNQRVIVESLHAKQALRPGLDVARATDILWTLNHPDVWLLLVLSSAHGASCLLSGLPQDRKVRVCAGHRLYVRNTRLVGERGWTPQQWEDWFADTTCAQLLRPRAGD